MAGTGEAEPEGFSAEEKAAMKERAREVRSRRRGKDQEPEVLAAIEKMSEPDRTIAAGLHALVKEEAPDLTAKTWYGMPAYARGKDVVVFFQASAKFSTRYSSVGFNDSAALDDGTMWPVAYAVTGWDDDVAARIRELVRRAVAGSD